MNDGEIQIQFPKPGDWTKLIMSVIYADALGFTHLDQYSVTTVPEEQIPAIAKAIEAIAALDEQWQACQVWARLGDIPSPSSPTDKVPAVLLTVELPGIPGVQKYLPLTNIPSSYSPIVVHYPSLTSSQKDDNHELTRTS